MSIFSSSLRSQSELYKKHKRKIWNVCIFSFCVPVFPHTWEWSCKECKEYHVGGTNINRIHQVSPLSEWHYSLCYILVQGTVSRHHLSCTSGLAALSDRLVSVVMGIRKQGLLLSASHSHPLGNHHYSNRLWILSSYSWNNDLLMCLCGLLLTCALCKFGYNYNIYICLKIKLVWCWQQPHHISMS